MNITAVTAMARAPIGISTSSSGSFIAGSPYLKNSANVSIIRALL
jgi:hypothetical protein